MQSFQETVLKAFLPFVLTSSNALCGTAIGAMLPKRWISLMQASVYGNLMAEVQTQNHI